MTGKEYDINSTGLNAFLYQTPSAWNHAFEELRRVHHLLWKLLDVIRFKNKYYVEP
jgi:hypothetical protein